MIRRHQANIGRIRVILEFGTHFSQVGPSLVESTELETISTTCQEATHRHTRNDARVSQGQGGGPQAMKCSRRERPAHAFYPPEVSCREVPRHDPLGTGSTNLRGLLPADSAASGTPIWAIRHPNRRRGSKARPTDQEPGSSFMAARKRSPWQKHARHGGLLSQVLLRGNNGQQAADCL